MSLKDGDQSLDDTYFELNVNKGKDNLSLEILFGILFLLVLWVPCKERLEIARKLWP